MTMFFMGLLVGFVVGYPRVIFMASHKGMSTEPRLKLKIMHKKSIPIRKVKKPL